MVTDSKRQNQLINFSKHCGEQTDGIISNKQLRSYNKRP